MNDRRFLVPFLNLGHLLDHLVMLVFPTVVIALAREWNQPYSEMLPLALGGFIAFGAFAIPAGWLAHHWSRYRMLAVFLFGIRAATLPSGFPTSARPTARRRHPTRGVVAFNPATVAMPKVFDERLTALTTANLGIGALVALVYAIAAFAQVLMGTLIDRFEMKHLMIAVGVVQIPLLGLAANLDGWPMLIVALCMMMAIFGQIPLNDAIVGKYVADEYRARVLSVRYVVSLGVASVAVPMIALLHRTEGGFRNVFLVLAALAIAVMTAAFFFPSKERLRQAPVAAT